jgi:hypothetical protein
MNSDLRAAVAVLSSARQNAEGRTAPEIAKELGSTKKRALEFVRQAIDAGICECAGRRQGIDIAGRNCLIPVYRFKKGKA